MRGKIFVVFLICFGFNIALNLCSYSQVIDPLCSFPAQFGFPFTAGTYGGFITTTNIYWLGALLNLLFAATVSALMSYIANKIYESRSRLY